MRYIVFIDVTRLINDNDVEISDELRNIFDDIHDVDVELHPLISSIIDTNNTFAINDDEQFNKLCNALRKHNIKYFAYRLID